MKGMLFGLSLLPLLVATAVFIPVGYSQTAELPVDLTADGKWLLTTDPARFGLTLLNTLSGESIPVAHTRGAGYYASFSPAGDYVCYKEIQIDGSGQIQCTPALFSLATRQTMRLAEPARLAGTPAVSQEGRIAYTTDEDLVVCLAGIDSRTRLSLGYHVNLMAFSPDGSSLVFPNANQQMMELVLEGQERRELFSDPRSGFWGAQFSPEGGYLLFQSVGGKIFTTTLATGSTCSLGKGCNPAWIEEGKVAFVRKSSDGRKVTSTQLLVWDAKGRSVQSLSLFKGDVEVRFKGAYAAVFQSSGAALHRIVREKAKYTLQSPGLRLQEIEEGGQNRSMGLFQDEVTWVRSAPVILSGVETVHQVYDTPNWFNGHWACGATSACMALTYYNLLPHWDTTVSVPYSHVSHFGRYVCETYTYNGFTFNIAGDDPNGTPATGGYGYIIQDNWEDTKGHMAEYISYHGPASSVDWSPSITKARNEIDDGHPFVVLNTLTSSGHYITCVGYHPDQHTLIFNDPYGNKNTPGYPSYDGTEVSYDWPGYNNGYQNLNAVGCYIYARMDPSGRFRNAIRNGGFEQDFEYWTQGGSTNHEILTSGAHGGDKACRFYRGDGYATIWQNPGERSGELWRATCYAYAFPGTVGPEFGFKDQVGDTEASVPIDPGSWGFYSVEWTIGDDIDVQAWGNNSSLGVAIDDVRAGKAGRMN